MLEHTTFRASSYDEARWENNHCVACVESSRPGRVVVVTAQKTTREFINAERLGLFDGKYCDLL